MQKTGEPVVISIHPLVNIILEKKGNLHPKLITGKNNEHLTVIGKKAEFIVFLQRNSQKEERK